MIAAAEPDFAAASTLRPGSAPPWLRGLVAAAQSGAFHRQLPERARRPQPVDSLPPAKQSAVLMAFSGDPLATTLPDDASVLLTHRTPQLRSHGGQLAFPGGRRDEADRNLVTTALREAWEETGVRPANLRPLALVDQVVIQATGYPVHPVLAYRPQRGDAYLASPGEADEVFDQPLAELLDPANRLVVGRGSWRGPAFRVRGYLLWGFTGGLLAVALRPWERPWDQDTVYDLHQQLRNSRNNESLA